MIETKTLDFLAQLKDNNNREWFEDNKKWYEQSKANVLDFVAALITELGKKDASIKHLEAKNCLMRIYRDVRFSKDKSPYKTNFGIGISANGRKVNEPGYYVHIQPKQNFLGGGYWMPEAEHLKSIRQEIDYNFKDFESVVKEKKFVQFFNTLDESEKLKTLPKGYTADNEAIEYLKLKSFVASTKLSEAEMQNPKLVGLLAERFTTMQPFISFLHSAISV